MTKKEMNVSLGNNIYTWNKEIQDNLDKQYVKLKEDNGVYWYKIGNNAFRVIPFERPLCGFIVEYAEGQDERALNYAEDVDQYPISDYSNVMELLNQIQTDIGQG